MLGQRSVCYLDVFWRQINPTDPSGQFADRGSQYRTAIFYHDEKQRRAGEDTRDTLAQKTGRTIHTAVVPLHSFNLAETYHQKYLLKQRPDLTVELSRIYPLNQDFIDSTATARLNGYVGGYGNPEQLIREIDSLGLSDSGRHILETLVD